MLPTGIHFESYVAETRILKTRRSQVWMAALVVGLLVAAPYFAGAYLTGIASEMFITLMAVYGLYVTVGMAGQINIAQSAFVWVGAFAAAKLSGYGMPVFLVIPIAALCTGLVSILFALPAARVKGLYLALTTLAAQAMFPSSIHALPAGWLGGLAGMPVEPLSLFGYDLGSPARLYYFTLAIVAVLTVSAFRLHHSRFGRAMIAVRDNDVAAEVMGIPVLKVKVMSFFVGSLFAGVAGACMAYVLQFVTASSFTLFASVWYLGMLIVGGLDLVVARHPRRGLHHRRPGEPAQGRQHADAGGRRRRRHAVRADLHHPGRMPSSSPSSSSRAGWPIAGPCCATHSRSGRSPATERIGETTIRVETGKTGRKTDEAENEIDRRGGLARRQPARDRCGICDERERRLLGALRQRHAELPCLA